MFPNTSLNTVVGPQEKWPSIFSLSNLILGLVLNEYWLCIYSLHNENTNDLYLDSLCKSSRFQRSFEVINFNTAAPATPRATSLILSFSILTTVRGKLHFWFSLKMEGGSRNDLPEVTQASWQSCCSNHCPCKVTRCDGYTTLWLYLACIG